MLKIKRKREAGLEVDLEEKLTLDKKTRLPKSPGQLRVEQELADFRADFAYFSPTPSPEVLELMISYPSSASMTRLSDRTMASFQFELHIPRFYPHNPPVVFLRQPSFAFDFLFSVASAQGFSVDERNTITHSMLQKPEWDATFDLYDVVNLLMGLVEACVLASEGEEKMPRRPFSNLVLK